MKDCEFLTECIFFNGLMKDMPAGARVFRRDFCLSDYNKCARYLIANTLGREMVPKDMFPNEHEEAKGMIKSSFEM